jgi:hypothetical protein
LKDAKLLLSEASVSDGTDIASAETGDVAIIIVAPAMAAAWLPGMKFDRMFSSKFDACV